MKNQTRKFEQQSGIEIYGLGKDRAKWEASLEKFAELIVKECMILCKTAVGNRDYNTGRMHCYDNIKKHFGVEE